MSLHYPTTVVTAGIDVTAGAVLVGWWADFLAHPVGVVATGLAGVWYAICIYEFITNRWFKCPQYSTLKATP